MNKSTDIIQKLQPPKYPHQDEDKNPNPRHLFSPMLRMEHSPPSRKQKTEEMRVGNSLFGLSLSVGAISGTNASFQNFVSEQFLIQLPSTRLSYTFYFHIYPQERATLTLGLNYRPNEESHNNKSLEWNQTRAFLDFEYAVFENKIFRIAPLVGLSYAENILSYSDNQVLGNQNTIPGLLGSTYKSLQLKQMSYLGIDAGVKVSFKIFKTFRISAFAKWEQSVSNSAWKIRQQKMDDMPKLSNSGVNYGVMIGF